VPVHPGLNALTGGALIGAGSRLKKLHHCHNPNTEKEKAMF